MLLPWWCLDVRFWGVQSFRPMLQYLSEDFSVLQTSTVVRMSQTKLSLQVSIKRWIGSLTMHKLILSYMRFPDLRICGVGDRSITDFYLYREWIKWLYRCAWNYSELLSPTPLTVVQFSNNSMTSGSGYSLPRAIERAVSPTCACSNIHKIKLYISHPVSKITPCFWYQDWLHVLAVPVQSLVNF